MLKSVEDISQTKKRLKIEIPADVIEREIQTALEKLRQTVQMPGFRAGKAPLRLIEKRYGKQVEADVLERVVPEQLTEAFREAALEPVTFPELEDEIEFKRNNPLDLTVTVEVKPKIDNLSYEQVTVPDIPVEVDEEEVEAALKALQNKRARFEVADTVVEQDDFVSFEYVDSESAEGVPLSEANRKEIVELGNEIFPPDLVEQVIGKKKGDTVTFVRTFTESDGKDLAGKTARITVRIAEVKRKVLPNIDDEFAKDLEYESVAELKEHLKEKILEAKKKHIKKIQKAQIVKKLVDDTEFDVPESMVRSEMEAILMHESVSGSREATTSPGMEAGSSDSGTSQPSQQESDAEARAKIRDKAVRSVKAHFILDTIASREGITVSDAEVDARIASLARELSASPEAVRTFYMYRDGSLKGLRHSILEEKVMDMLVARATVEKENA